MKLIESKAELIPQQEGLEGIYKQIEVCGRTCYKSEDKITEDSARRFVERLIKAGHTAMLEHGTVYLRIPVNIDIAGNYLDDTVTWTKCNLVQEKEPKDNWWAITTNYRVMTERKWLDDLKYICEPTEHHERRYTFKLITDIGVGRELTRHRVFSFAQESTRYCNYSKDKFKGVTFIIPTWLNSVELDFKDVSDIKEWLSVHNISTEDIIFIESCWRSEETYLRLIELGTTAQQARQVLPLSTKTEVCMTGFASDWRFFFDLRFYGETGKPHPDMELLAGKARSEFMKAGLWDNIMTYPTKFDKDDTEGKD